MKKSKLYREHLETQAWYLVSEMKRDLNIAEKEMVIIQKQKQWKKLKEKLKDLY